jgi:hypothetical protein
MPFCRCPKCKVLFTVQVDDEKKWRAEKWPDYAASELVPETCAACTKKAHDLEIDGDSGQQLPQFGKF